MIAKKVTNKITLTLDECEEIFELWCKDFRKKKLKDNKKDTPKEYAQYAAGYFFRKVFSLQKRNK